MLAILNVGICNRANSFCTIYFQESRQDFPRLPRPIRRTCDYIDIECQGGSDMKVPGHCEIRSGFEAERISGQRSERRLDSQGDLKSRLQCME